MNKYLNRTLLDSKQMIDRQLSGHSNNFKLTFADVEIDTLKIGAGEFRSNIEFKDTAYRDDKGELDLYRQLSYKIDTGDKRLLIKIRQSTESTDMQVMKFTFMLATFPVIFFLILFFVNRQSVKRSLSVFYDTIEKLKTFDVNKENQFQLMTSDVDEFEKLNEVFNAMENKLKEDFVRLKEYTENTSHELQTPLAILSSKLDELLQSPNLNSKQVETIAGLIETTSRLSRINQALIFLAKIDNRLFDQSDKVNVNQLIRSMLDNLEVLWEDQNLKVTTQFENELIVIVNQNLLQTLIQNLIKNAIRHNIKDGFIHIVISDNEMMISNSGEPLEFEANEAFSRYKNRGHHLSMGIGLSIAKRITEVSNIDISYENIETTHNIKLLFNKVEGIRTTKN